MYINASTPQIQATSSAGAAAPKASPAAASPSAEPAVKVNISPAALHAAAAHRDADGDGD